MTGVQTCALPIYDGSLGRGKMLDGFCRVCRGGVEGYVPSSVPPAVLGTGPGPPDRAHHHLHGVEGWSRSPQRRIGSGSRYTHGHTPTHTDTPDSQRGGTYSGIVYV